MGWIYVAVGGALGALFRFGVSGWVQELSAGTFPWGTLTVNVLGSLLLGFLVVWLESTVASGEIRLFVTIGLLGGFTTFSTFTYEAAALLRGGDWWAAGGYMFGSLAAGLLGVVFGIGLASQLLMPRG